MLILADKAEATVDKVADKALIALDKALSAEILDAVSADNSLEVTLPKSIPPTVEN